MNALTRIIVIGMLVLPVGSALGAPVGYSVNSDEPSGDELHVIDLATGSATSRGPVRSATVTYVDVEGLALDPDGNLWAVDESTLSLFPVSKGNGTVDSGTVRPIVGLDALAGNDFGMTFTCDGDLFVTSVADGALYRLDLGGSASKVGDLGANISALAAYGNPTRLFGLSNGLLDDSGNVDTRSLYEIDPDTGALTLLGPLGAAASAYFEAGLSFDADGHLWAITDRRSDVQELPSEILRLDLSTGAATLVATTAGSGFESLAVAPPGGCEDVTPPPPREPDFVTPFPHIPTLDAGGRLATILVLLLAGLAVLRRP